MLPRPPPSSLGYDEIELQELASAVRQLQKQDVCDAKGRGWVEWVRSCTELPESQRTVKDPTRHTSKTLRAFLAAVPRERSDDVDLRIKRAQHALAALRELKEAYAAADGDTAAHATQLFTLMEHTRAHPRFIDNYGSLSTQAAGWVMAPRKMERVEQAHAMLLPGVESLLFAIDCEMVATADDDNALARVSICDATGRVLMDRIVRPDSTPIELRTHITGFVAEDLEAAQYTREDVQREILELLTPHAVIVGHTLHKDLAALRLDATLVLDIALLYGFESCPRRMPSLAHLVETVLGRTGFRGQDGQAPHSCVDDVRATMELALHRLRGATQSPIPPIIWVAPPPNLHGLKEDVAADRTLYAHNIPDTPGAFVALVSLLAKVKNGALSEGLEGVDMHPPINSKNQKRLRSATLVFVNWTTAMDAFMALPASAVTKDRLGRPQKTVELLFQRGRAAMVHVRTGALVSGLLPQQEGDAAIEPSQNSRGRAPQRPTWLGWQHAVDEELKVAPGCEMPWKRLRTALVARYHAAGEAGGSNDEELGWRALANISESYLSDADALVRLPMQNGVGGRDA